MYNIIFFPITFLKYIVLCEFLYHYNIKNKSNHDFQISKEMILSTIPNSNKNIILNKIMNLKIIFDDKIHYCMNSKGLESFIYLDISTSELYIIFNSTEVDFTMDFVKDITNCLKMKKKTIGTDKKILVHSGYYNLLYEENFINNIFRHIEEKNFVNVNIIGHSAGGGMATILSYILLKKYPNIKINLNTFGSIRVGNKNFIDYLAKSKNIIITTIINNHDFAPLFCPNYNHFDKIITITNNKTIVNDTIISIRNNYSITNHYFINYYTNLYNLI